jgi:hypothetical protein
MHSFQPPAVNSKKGRKCELAALYYESKGFTRATNATTLCHKSTFFDSAKRFAERGAIAAINLCI